MFSRVGLAPRAERAPLAEWLNKLPCGACSFLSRVGRAWIKLNIGEDPDSRVAQA
jgi:hypothetical protein